jgi:hypothetical protein
VPAEGAGAVAPPRRPPGRGVEAPQSAQGGSARHSGAAKAARLSDSRFWAPGSRDTDLAPRRPREDFQEFAAELEALAKP